MVLYLDYVIYGFIFETDFSAIRLSSDVIRNLMNYRGLEFLGNSFRDFLGLSGEFCFFKVVASDSARIILANVKVARIPFSNREVIS